MYAQTPKITWSLHELAQTLHSLCEVHMDSFGLRMDWQSARGHMGECKLLQSRDPDKFDWDDFGTTLMGCAYCLTRLGCHKEALPLM
jgi:hypothetical protein